MGWLGVCTLVGIGVNPNAVSNAHRIDRDFLVPTVSLGTHTELDTQDSA